MRSISLGSQVRRACLRFLIGFTCSCCTCPRSFFRVFHTSSEQKRIPYFPLPRLLGKSLEPVSASVSFQMASFKIPLSCSSTTIPGLSRRIIVKFLINHFPLRTLSEASFRGRYWYVVVLDTEVSGFMAVLHTQRKLTLIRTLRIHLCQPSVISCVIELIQSFPLLVRQCRPYRLEKTTPQQLRRLLGLLRRWHFTAEALRHFVRDVERHLPHAHVTIMC